MRGKGYVPGVHAWRLVLQLPRIPVAIGYPVTDQLQHCHQISLRDSHSSHFQSTTLSKYCLDIPFIYFAFF